MKSGAQKRKAREKTSLALDAKKTKAITSFTNTIASVTASPQAPTTPFATSTNVQSSSTTLITPKATNSGALSLLWSLLVLHNRHILLL